MCPRPFPEKQEAIWYTNQVPSKADVAQLVEQPIRNRQVIGSSPIVGSSLFRSLPISSPKPVAQVLHKQSLLPIVSWPRSRFVTAS